MAMTPSIRNAIMSVRFDDSSVNAFRRLQIWYEASVTAAK